MSSAEKINTSPATIERIRVGLVSDYCGANEKLEADALVCALAAERDALRARAEQAERREAAMKSANEEARQFLRQRDALRAENERLKADRDKYAASAAAFMAYGPRE